MEKVEWLTVSEIRYRYHLCYRKLILQTVKLMCMFMCVQMTQIIVT